MQYNKDEKKCIRIIAKWFRENKRTVNRSEAIKEFGVDDDTYDVLMKIMKHNGVVEVESGMREGYASLIRPSAYAEELAREIDIEIEPEPKEIANELDNGSQSVRAIAIRSAAAELEQIANNFENWAKKERAKYVDPNGVKPPAFTLAQIEDWVNTYLLKQRLVAVFFSHPKLSYNKNSVLTPFLTTYERKKFHLIIDVFRLHMPSIATSLKELYDEFWEDVRYHIECYERSKKVQQENIPSIGESVENTSWNPTLFLDGTVATVIIRLRHIAEMVKKNLATSEPAETTDERDEVTPTSQPDSILGDTWSILGIPINVKKLCTKLKSRPVLLGCCLLAIVLSATCPVWWPIINKTDRDPTASTNIFADVSKDGSILRSNNFPWEIRKSNDQVGNILYTIVDRRGDATAVSVVPDNPKYTVYQSYDGMVIKFTCSEEEISNFTINLKY